MAVDKETTSWNRVDAWYNSIVGEAGHYYHKELILPKLLPMLSLVEGSKLLDIACGQGVLSRAIPRTVSYTGLDIAPNLISTAKQLSRNKHHRFLCHDVTSPWPLAREEKYTHATCVLALQNIKEPAFVFQELAPRMDPGGLFAVILNHPCFRIPRHSKWTFDDKTKSQHREMFLYMTPQSIPITAHPGQKNSETTWSFHFPLHTLSKMAYDNGFTMLLLDEWVSPKTSTGSAQKWENRARKEFPLFLCALFEKRL